MLTLGSAYALAQRFRFPRMGRAELIAWFLILNMGRGDLRAEIQPIGSAPEPVAANSFEVTEEDVGINEELEAIGRNEIGTAQKAPPH